MGLLCSKCSLKSVTSRKENPTTIEIHNSPETSAFLSKFIRRKIAKKRPVISAPRPANPVFLHGRKWKHVIVTIPTIDDPPVPPVRKKRKAKKTEIAELKSLRLAKKMAFFELMNAMQLRRCLRLLGTGVDLLNESKGGKKRVGDLFFSTLHGNETAIMVFASVPFNNIDYGENRSLTNELNDSFFDNANVCGYGFKNFILFEARPLKRDLDKLKFCKICRPAFERFSAKCIEIRAATVHRDTAKNEKSLYVLMLRNINQTRAITALPESSTLNVKNISNKTNQKRNNIYRTSSANIEKVCKKMKKTLPPQTLPKPGAIPENHSNPRCIPTSDIDNQSIVTSSTRERCKYINTNIESDRNDSDCSITDSLNEFSYSLLQM